MELNFFPDLRAVLKLQPSNAEAAAELDKIVSLRHKSKTRPNRASSSATGDTSSAAGHTVHKSDIPTPHTANDPLPFARTYRDNYKLKISSLPLTIPAASPFPNTLTGVPSTALASGPLPSSNAAQARPALLVPPFPKVRTTVRKSNSTPVLSKLSPTSRTLPCPICPPSAPSPHPTQLVLSPTLSLDPYRNLVSRPTPSFPLHPTRVSVPYRFLASTKVRVTSNG